MISHINVELDDWETGKLMWHATTNAATYLGHFGRGGRWTLGELEEANRWLALSRKLTGDKPSKPLTPGDFPKSTFGGKL
jgi:hypothetical protein